MKKPFESNCRTSLQNNINIFKNNIISQCIKLTFMKAREGIMKRSDRLQNSVSEKKIYFFFFLRVISICQKIKLPRKKQYLTPYITYLTSGNYI